MNKKALALTTITIVILTLIGGGVFWYFSKYQGTSNPPIPAVGRASNEQDDEQKQNEPEQTPISTSQTNDNQKYQGETVKEADGWKKYTNKYFGVEFRFRDEGDKFIVNSNRDGLEVIYKNWRELTMDDEKPYIYINTFGWDYSPDFNLKNYLEKGGWIHYQNQSLDGFMSIEEITNNNNLIFFKIISNMPAGHFSDYMDEDGNSISETLPELVVLNEYFTEYNKLENNGYIYITGDNDTIKKQIVNSFNFINAD